MDDLVAVGKDLFDVFLYVFVLQLTAAVRAFNSCGFFLFTFEGIGLVPIVAVSLVVGIGFETIGIQGKLGKSKGWLQHSRCQWIREGIDRVDILRVLRLLGGFDN